MLFMISAVVSNVTKATKLKRLFGTWIFWQRIMSPQPAVNEKHRRHRGRDKPAAWKGSCREQAAAVWVGGREQQSPSS